MNLVSLRRARHGLPPGAVAAIHGADREKRRVDDGEQGRAGRAARPLVMLRHRVVLVPRLAAAGPDSDLSRIDALAALRVGMNLVSLRRPYPRRRSREAPRR
jgi:hypothetical protein